MKWDAKMQLQQLCPRGEESAEEGGSTCKGGFARKNARFKIPLIILLIDMHNSLKTAVS
jgi:hypothetical protein